MDSKTPNAKYAGRREDGRLLRGAGKYTSDWSRAGQCYGAFLRSDVPHGDIVSIDTSSARSAAGVIDVLTGHDALAAGFRRSKAHIPVPGTHGPLIAPDMPALASEKVRYVGEPIALIVAETVAQARDALELISLEIEALEVVASPEEAIADGAVTIHKQIEGNVCFENRYGDAEATAKAFATADFTARIDVVSTRLAANPMEPQAALVDWEEDGLHIWCPSQGMTGLRSQLTTTTGLAPDAIHIWTEDVGGAFGVRGDAYPEYVALALASRRIGRPVKWIASRSETFVSDMHGRAMRMTAEMALDAEGRFLAIRHDWLCDVGAHPSGAGPLTPLLNSGLMAVGAYRIGCVSGRNRMVVTNLAPVSAYRGAARPEMAYAVERLVDEAARITGLDRIEIRRRNLLPPSEFPVPITTFFRPVSYDSADFPAMIEAGLEASDWAGFEERRAASANEGRLRGIGCALFIEPSGGVSPTDVGAITFGTDGKIYLDQVANASGQGHETVFPEIVASVLEIAPEALALRFPSTTGPAQTGGGAFGSRSLMSQGSVLDEAARVALGKARVLASEMLGADAGSLEYADGTFSDPRGNRFVGLTDLAQQFPGALDCTAELPAPVAFPSGFHVAEVEIDPETGVCRLAGYVSVDDCGTVVNEMLVHGQIHGGLAQGLGQVFGESVEYDQDAQLLSGSFMDYFMPRADFCPKPELILKGVPSPTNRLGAKGVGEAGTVGAMPAAMNAIVDALRTADVDHFDLPASPGRIWQALQDAQTRS